MSEKAPLTLVVEDELAVRELLTDILWDEGYSVVEANDGKQALQLLDELILPSNRPCVVVLDMMLPSVSGLDVLEHLKTRGSHVPVVALSASLPHVAAARAAGARVALAKPFDLDQLTAVVAQYRDSAKN